MLQFDVSPNEILEAMQQEFPKEFMIAAQRVHIRKLEEHIKLLDPSAANEEEGVKSNGESQ